PGLVNAHMHTWETALRGIGAEWMSADYFKHVHSNLATRYKPEDNYVANLMGALAQIDAGERAHQVGDVVVLRLVTRRQVGMDVLEIVRRHPFGADAAQRRLPGVHVGVDQTR